MLSHNCSSSAQIRLMQLMFLIAETLLAQRLKQEKPAVNKSLHMTWTPEGFKKQEEQGGGITHHVFWLKSEKAESYFARKLKIVLQKKGQQTKK